MRVLVCGGREFTDRGRLDRALAAFNRACPISVLIEGDARGADRFAGEWGRANGITVLVFPAEWERLGRAAGLIRNEQMLREGKPDVVLAFPGGRGTAHMKRIAAAAGVPVCEV
jgi:hypothetical protein